MSYYPPQPPEWYRPQQVVYVERRARDHGCLIWTILLTLVLGPFGLLLGASAGLFRGLWRGLESFTRQYGWRGWLVVGGVLVALAVIGAITGAH